MLIHANGFVCCIKKQNRHETYSMFADLNLNVALSLLHTLFKKTYTEELDTLLRGRGADYKGTGVAIISGPWVMISSEGQGI